MSCGGVRRRPACSVNARAGAARRGQAGSAAPALRHPSPEPRGTSRNPGARRAGRDRHDPKSFRARIDGQTDENIQTSLRPIGTPPGARPRDHAIRRRPRSARCCCSGARAGCANASVATAVAAMRRRASSAIGGRSRSPTKRGLAFLKGLVDPPAPDAVIAAADAELARDLALRTKHVALSAAAPPAPGAGEVKTPDGAAPMPRVRDV